MPPKSGRGKGVEPVRGSERKKEKRKPETSEDIPSRSRPKVVPDAPVLPSPIAYVRLLHPANGRRFLALPAYDHLPGPPVRFGLHYETVRTACMIVAHNCPGYLSLFRERDATPLSLSQNSLLAPGSYYYHLSDSRANELYPICLEFRDWVFPHGHMPSSWSSVPPSYNPNWPTDWTAASQEVKNRDQACLVSGSIGSNCLTSAHVVPEGEARWLEDNDMGAYLGDDMPLHQSPKNLFSLRWDLRLGEFDLGHFTIVPKNGKLVVHFLEESQENARFFHNIVFDHQNHLSHEALYSHFAWALFRRLKVLQIDPEWFEYHEGEGGKREPRKKRKREPEERGDGEGNGGERREGMSGTKRRGPKSTFGHGDPNAFSLQPDNWLSDVVYKVAPGKTQSSLDADIREIEEDLNSRTCHHHPFLADSSIVPSPHDYHNLLWYPGMGVVERRKQAYLDRHPNIRAYSGPLLQEGMDDDDL